MHRICDVMICGQDGFYRVRRIDTYNNGLGVLKGQRHIPSKNFSLAVRIQRITLAQKSRNLQVMIDRIFIHLAIYFRTSMASQCKLNLLWFKTGRFADHPDLHSMKVFLPWYNHPFRFDQLHGPIRTVLLLKIKTLFEITHAFQKMALVAEVLVSLRHFKLWWCFDTTLCVIAKCGV